MGATLKILFLAAEAEPFIKIGGLADVAGSLPLALRRLPTQATGGLTLDVRLVIPLHRSIRAEATTLHTVADFPVFRHGRNRLVQLFELPLSGMPVYFINGDHYRRLPPFIRWIRPRIARNSCSFPWRRWR